MIVQEDGLKRATAPPANIGPETGASKPRASRPIARKVLWGIAGTVVVAAGAYLLLRGGKPIPYRLATVDRGNIESSISATGTPNAVKDVLVGSQVSGNISELFADFNTKVTKGQVIARIDPQNFEAQVAVAEASLSSAQAQVSNARAGIEKATADVAAAQANILVARQNTAKAQTEAEDAGQKLARRQPLLVNGAVSVEEGESARTSSDTAQSALETARAQERAAQAQYDAAVAGLNAAQTQQTAAEASVRQSEANLSNARINLDHTYIRAPVDGTVVSRKVDVGQTVAASMQAPTLFEIAQDLTKMQVDTSVDEADVGRVRVGQTARFTVDAYPGQYFRGSVREIRKAPVNVQNVVTYDVVIAVDNPDLKLFPGMTANVTILIERKTNVLRVPNAALRFTPAGSKRDVSRDSAKQGSRTVWTADKDGVPRPVTVQTGISDGNYTEVVSGLTVGMRLITGETSKATPATPARGPGF